MAVILNRVPVTGLEIYLKLHSYYELDVNF